MFKFIKELFSREKYDIIEVNEDEIEYMKQCAEEYRNDIKQELRWELKTSLLKELDKVENMISKQQLKAIIEWVFR